MSSHPPSSQSATKAAVFLLWEKWPERKRWAGRPGAAQAFYDWLLPANHSVVCWGNFGVLGARTSIELWCAQWQAAMRREAKLAGGKTCSPSALS